MPFKSEKQKAYLWENEPEVAKKFAKHKGKKKSKSYLAEKED